MENGDIFIYIYSYMVRARHFRRAGPVGRSKVSLHVSAVLVVTQKNETDANGLVS